MLFIPLLLLSFSTGLFSFIGYFIFKKSLMKTVSVYAVLFSTYFLLFYLLGFIVFKLPIRFTNGLDTDMMIVEASIFIYFRKSILKFIKKNFIWANISIILIIVSIILTFWIYK